MKQEHHRNRSGQALVEFALVALALVIVLSSGLGIGLMMLHAGITNSVASSSSNLLDLQIQSLVGITDEDVYDQLKTLGFYDETKLLLSSEGYAAAYDDPQFPAINKMMLSLYQFDPDFGGYRYPGAIVSYNGDPSILIPFVSRAGATESITNWFRPLSVTVIPNVDSSKAPTACRVSINMASQAASMIAYRVHPYPEPNAGDWVVADDAVSSNAAMPSGYSLGTPPTPLEEAPSAVNRGQYGLGELYNFTVKVRPYRKVFFRDAVFRLLP
ncbi:MAG: pilus assembly protein [Planctomycetes bacterium]|nr:pilus assembly protein [Planctomycetota bacterium]